MDKKFCRAQSSNHETGQSADRAVPNLLSGYAFMKTMHFTLLSGLLLCGCSHRQATSAIDLVKAGTDLTWNFDDNAWSKHGACVLHIAQRDGSSLKGIRLVLKIPDGWGGQETTLTTDAGSLSPGSIENAADKTYVRITLNTPTSQSANSRQHLPSVTYVLHK
ncbi:MAG TPA: hypothetical protein VFC85_07850 [Verrucomicrobiae bacterium]|nr:hypothetical protein [Verrucomicrobiae bacterium]